MSAVAVPDGLSVPGAGPASLTAAGFSARAAPDAVPAAGLEAAAYRLDARRHLLGVEGLDYVVVRAELESAYSVVYSTHGGYEYNRYTHGLYIV